MSFFRNLGMITLVLCLLQKVHAGAMIDTLTPKSYHLELSAGGNYSTTTPSKESIMFHHQVGLGLEKKKLELNTKATWIYELQNRSLTKNDFNFTLDFNYYLQENKKFYTWGLNNYQSAYSLKIRSQYQAGVGLAYELINTNHFFLRISDGVLWEASNIIKMEELINYATWRNSLRIQFKYGYKDLIHFNYIGYWQPSLMDFQDQQIKMTASLNIKIWKQLDFKIEGQYNLVTATHQSSTLLVYGVAYQVDL